MVALAATPSSFHAMLPAYSGPSNDIVILRPPPPGSLHAIRDAQYQASLVKEKEDVVKAVPDLPAGHIVLSQYYLTHGRSDQAISEMEAALRLDPNSPDTVREMGNLRYSLGQRDDAMALWAKAFELHRQRVRHPVTDPSDPSVKEAALYGQVAADASPNDPGVHADLGDALWRTGDLDGAMAEYRKAIAMEPGLAPSQGINFNSDLGASEPFWQLVHAHSGLANCLKDLGRFDDAIREYRQVLRTALSERAYALYNPDASADVFELASALALSRNTSEAIELLKPGPMEVANYRRWYVDYFSSDPDFDSIRHDPAFQAVIAPQGAAQ
jgi:tetratricopeptide (TPR) repeat protein